MDLTARSGWESSVIPHLDDIPITLAGKGEQSCVKIKLALMAEEAAEVVLIEEPENHLSHTNLNRLISQLSAQADGKQLIIATHSSFVLNKLGIERTQLFNGEVGVTIASLSEDTRDYFKRLPGHNTLRMILARKVILVEGPSDELIVQRAFHQKEGILPIEAGVEVISVNSLAFRRFLEIGKALRIPMRVVIDNDGKAESVRDRFKEFKDDESIRLCISDDNGLRTLENHLVSVNGLRKLNEVLGEEFKSEPELLEFMLDNKTESALKLFESPEPLNFPKYILDAIE